MGLSWISRKGGILEKGEGGGYEPPYHDQSSCRSIKQTNCLRTTLNTSAAIFSANFFDNFLNLSLFSNIIHFPYNCQSYIISNIGKSTSILIFPCLISFQSCTTKILVLSLCYNWEYLKSLFSNIMLWHNVSILKRE